jgi:uncharacterized iron-regulated membrane protein
MAGNHQLTVWTRWVRQPQKIWLRKALFQVHLWSGVGIGLYVLMISVTGSILVYRNELYEATAPQPLISRGSDPLLTDDQLREAATRRYTGYTVVELRRAQNPDQAVDVSLRRGDDTRTRLFDPRTGEDLGATISVGFWFVSTMLDLHDNLLSGETGRHLNGVGACVVLVIAMTGVGIWWPGIRTWRRSLTLHRGVGWQRMTWHLHSMIGFWTLGFTLVFGLSGMYLAFPDAFQLVADRLDPITEADTGSRISDEIIYWLAYLHFGRINGIGIPCGGPGLCDQATKATWAIFGLAPAAMFVTGAIMWWIRVVRPRWRALARLRGGPSSKRPHALGAEPV